MGDEPNDTPATTMKLSSGDTTNEEPQTHLQENEQIAYTTFSLPYRWYLTLLLGYLCLASSLTANIYFPLIRLLATHYNTSIQGINLTITLYIVIQGLCPSIFSPLSDTLGRRPVYIISFALYTTASLGLVFSGNSYVALLLLRALQSMGGSATMSLAYAVVADYTVHSERGKFLWPMMTAVNLGPSIGPVIGGGAILATGKVAWAFWALFIFGGSALVLIVFSMRETNRRIVGNGRIDAQGLWRAWGDIILLRRRRRRRKNEDASTEVRIEPNSEKLSKSPEIFRQSGALVEQKSKNVNSSPIGRGVLKFPNPFISLRILFYRDAFTILCLAALPYGAWYTISTSIPLIYGIEYRFNDLVVGCCYLAGGGGILCGGFAAGHLMDINYKHTAKSIGLAVDRVAGDDMRSFPIEKARSRGSYLIISLTTLGFVAYGWVAQKRVHFAIPLILQFFLGGCCTILHQIYSALLVDVFQENPGTAGAANNICRCALAATAVAIMQPVVEAIGRGWFFTSVAVLMGVGGGVGVFVLRRWGWMWREERIVGTEESRE